VERTEHRYSLKETLMRYDVLELRGGLPSHVLGIFVFSRASSTLKPRRFRETVETVLQVRHNQADQPRCDGERSLGFRLGT